MKRGLKANLPELDEAEFALTKDTKEVFIGTDANNLRLLDEKDKVEINNQISSISFDIEDGSITPNKTSFFKYDYQINLFNGNYIKNTLGGASTFSLVASEVDRTAKVPVEPNTTYTILKPITSRFKVATDTVLERPTGIMDGSIVLTLAGTNTRRVITTGPNDKVLYVNYSNTSEDVVIQIAKGDLATMTVTDYSYKPTNNVSIYTKQEVNQLLAGVGVEKKITVIKTGKNLSIHVPQKKSTNYVKYEYNYINSPTVNMNQWRVSKAYVADKDHNVLYDFDTQTEWEGAILEKDTADAIGGYHGDERNVSFHILLDGVPTDINGTDFSKQVSEVRITNVSILNRCDTPGVDLFKRYRVNTWTIEHYTVENKYIALQAIELERANLTMFSANYSHNNVNMIERARSDYNYEIVDLTTNFSTSSISVSQKDVREFEMWGRTSGIYASVRCDFDYSKYPNRGQYISDFRSSGQDRLKVYFRTGQYSIAENEEIKCKATFKIKC